MTVFLAPRPSAVRQIAVLHGRETAEYDRRLVRKLGDKA
jgi:hypothetical protein